MPKEDTQFKPGNPGGPGRPPGSRSVETLFRDAIAKIAKDQNIEDGNDGRCIFSLIQDSHPSDSGPLLEIICDYLQKS